MLCLIVKGSFVIHVTWSKGENMLLTTIAKIVKQSLTTTETIKRKIKKKFDKRTRNIQQRTEAKEEFIFVNIQNQKERQTFIIEYAVMFQEVFLEL